MADFPGFADLFRVGRDEALIRNGQLSAEVIQREGTDANILIASAAAIGDEVVGQIADVAAGSFLDSAQGIALDRVVFDRYGLVRKSASPAVGSVQFSTTLPAPSAFAIPVGTKVSSSDGIQFVTTASVTFPMGGVGPVTVAIQSTLAGINQQAQANTITSIVGSIPGAAPGLRVNNPLATAGADDAETDPSLRDRARRFFVNARRGTLGAIEAGALAVPGVRTATAFEVIDVSGRPARVVLLAITDAFTEQLIGTNPVPLSYQTQSQVLAQTVFNSLNDVRPAGIFVQVTVAKVVLLPIQLALGFTTSANPDDAALQARGAIVGYVNALAPGRPFVVADAINALRSIRGLIILGSEIVSPAGNVQPRTLEVLRTSMSLVTALSLLPTAPIQNTTNPDAFSGV